MDDLRLIAHHRPSPADTPEAGKHRFRLTLAFDGGAYSGWQRQANGPSVQQTLEEAFLRVARERVCVVGSSRTDAGVHAQGMVAHLDSATRIPPEKLAFALNTALPEDVRVLGSELAPAGFHARFSAAGKIYRYRIWNARHMNPIGRRYRMHVPVPLDDRRMDEAAQSLLGTHDFSAFAASGSVARSAVRTIYRARVARRGDEVSLLVLGDGFLYNMVRIIAGTLIEVGQGKRAPDAFSRAIASGNRLDLGQTAEACGLTLEAALYAGEEDRVRRIFETF